MNAPLLPEVLTLREPSPQYSLGLATPGVQRYLWESRFGPVLIEVIGDDVYVNQERVVPAIPRSPEAP